MLFFNIKAKSLRVRFSLQIINTFAELRVFELLSGLFSCGTLVSKALL